MTRSQPVNVYLDDLSKKVLREEADAQGLSLSGFLRRLARDLKAGRVRFA